MTWELFLSLPRFSYGSEWVLQDQGTGTVFEALGSRFARGLLGGMGKGDTRSLAEVGIKPGMHLQIMRRQ